MCRSIKTLRTEAVVTAEDTRAAALQYVRKVSGLGKPPAADVAAFEKAVEEVARVTDRLLHSLSAHTHVRTREGEKAKARARWEQREERVRR